MNKVKLALAATVIFVAGLVVGYRATMHNAMIEITGPTTAAITAWGLTDEYYMEMEEPSYG